MGPYATPNILSAMAVAARHRYVLPQHTAVIAPQLTYECQFPAWSIGPTPNQFVPTQLFEAVGDAADAAEADRDPDQPERVDRLRLLRRGQQPHRRGVHHQGARPGTGARGALPAHHHRLGADRGPGAGRQAGPGHQQRPRRRPGEPAAGDGAAELQAADDVQPLPGARPAARPRRDRRTACCRSASSSPTRRRWTSSAPRPPRSSNDFKTRATAAKLPYTVFETQAAASWNAWEILTGGVKSAGKLDQQAICDALHSERRRDDVQPASSRSTRSRTTSGRPPRPSSRSRTATGSRSGRATGPPASCRARPADRRPGRTGPRQRSRMTIVQAALSGILLGGLYALMAAGVSVTWGVLRIINLAHFGMILLGVLPDVRARLGVGASTRSSRSWSACRRCSCSAAPPSGRSTTCASPSSTRCWSRFGLLIIIVQSVSNVWSADFQRMTAAVNPYATESVRIGRFVFPVPTLLAFAVALVRDPRRAPGAAAHVPRPGAARVRRGPPDRRGVRHRPPAHRRAARRGRPARPPRSPACCSRSGTRSPRRRRSSGSAPCSRS